MIRPSSLPMIAQCAEFESSSTEFAELGTDRHDALKAHLNGDDQLLDLLDEESQAGVLWAAGYIRANTTESHPVEYELKRSWTRPNFTQAEGTPDIVNGPTIFDFKWRYRDYTAQMADYALERIERGFDKVTVHVLYGFDQRTEKLVLDVDACEKIVLPILERAENPSPTPCDYCGWCAKRLTCPALTGPAETVARGYAEPSLLMDIQDWHPSQMLDKPEQLAMALTIWRKILKKWGESVEFHAMEAAIKQGLKLPGYELKSKRGRQFVSDVEKAFSVSGLEAKDFLQACDVRLNTSKKYPDRKGLDALFREKFQESSLAASKRSVLKKLGDLVQRRNDVMELKGVKASSDDNEEE